MCVYIQKKVLGFVVVWGLLRVARQPDHYHPPPNLHTHTVYAIHTRAPFHWENVLSLLDGGWNFFSFKTQGPMNGIRVRSAAAAIFQSLLVSNFSTWNSVPNIQLHIERLLSRLHQKSPLFFFLKLLIASFPHFRTEIFQIVFK